MLHNYRQSVVYTFAEILPSVHQVLNPLHENFHAAINMHREDSSQAAGTYRDRMYDEARQTLQPEKDLVDGIISRVDDYLGDREYQTPMRQIDAIGDLASGEWHSNIIEHGTAIHEK